MKINYGPCVVCGKPIIFLGCKYCGPKCHFSVLEPADPEPEEEAAVPAQTSLEEAESPPESQERPTEQEAPEIPKRRLYL